MNPQLTEYIDKCRKKGISDTDIKNNLLQSGWNEVDIDAALKNNVNLPNQDSLQTPATSDQRQMSVLAIVGFILSFFLAPVGFILSIIALFRIKKKKQNGIGFAIAGLIIGIIITSLLALWVYAIFSVVNTFNDVFSSGQPGTSGLIACDDVSISIVEAAGSKNICLNENKLALLADNVGTTDIHSWKVLFTTDSFIRSELNQSLESGMYGLLSFDFDNININELNSISIIPYLTSPSGSTPCFLPELGFMSYQIAEMDNCDDVSWDD